MQTFLPYADFDASAAVLDDRRLGKQRVEAYQILRALLGESRGWVHHPAVKMWAGHEAALVDYTVACCREWRRRGFADTVEGKTRLLALRHHLSSAGAPSWLGDPALHRSHRSNLLRKDRGFYEPCFEPGLPPDLPYVWPAG